jgi:hypothetical protein
VDVTEIRCLAVGKARSALKRGICRSIFIQRLTVPSDQNSGDSTAVNAKQASFLAGSTKPSTPALQLTSPRRRRKEGMGSSPAARVTRRGKGRGSGSLLLHGELRRRPHGRRRPRRADGRPPPAAPSASHTAPSSARPDGPLLPPTTHSDHHGRA